MISWGLYRGERFQLRQVIGLLLAFAGLVGLMLPGISAPSLQDRC
jgi:drug/metabolite transporter (DMT)-like permease